MGKNIPMRPEKASKTRKRLQKHMRIPRPPERVNNGKETSERTQK